MQIATFLDAKGEIANPYEAGRVRLFDDAGGGWQAVGEVTFAISPGARLAELKSAVRRMAAEIPQCRVFLSTEHRGILAALLQEEMGFHIWKSAGPLTGQLDEIAAHEAELAEAERQAGPCATASCASSGCGGASGGRAARGGCGPAAPAPSALWLERLGAQEFRFDLAAVLASDATLNSRQLLLPILEDRAFDRLEILCDHVPRWFSRALADCNLRADFDLAGNGVRVQVFRND